ncbi:DUF84 family protein [Aeribacillus sp. FSL K6-8394]|uniref:DUF84 family protein n=1 Tax=Aeribacillus sp. FSL K6-8394 TaxID=2954570 RepID=UPI0030FAFB8B
MNVAIGSKNLAKINAVKETFSLLEEKNIEFISVDVPSGVSTQPFSNEETLQGALNRAKNVFEKVKPDLSVGLEGGVDVTSRGLFLCNWGALIDKDGNEYIAGGARIPLPNEFLEPLKKGLELGDVMDAYAKKRNVRHREGAIGIFTNGFIDRKEMFAHIVKLLIGQYQFSKKN